MTAEFSVLFDLNVDQNLYKTNQNSISMNSIQDWWKTVGKCKKRHKNASKQQQKMTNEHLEMLCLKDWNMSLKVASLCDLVVALKLYKGHDD